MPTKKNNFHVYTDGSCRGNPGPGGWAAIILENDGKKKYAVLKGAEAKTTNNRMEMIGVIEALRFLSSKKLQSSAVTLFSDSNLVISTLTKGWKRKANLDLWEELDALDEEFEVEYIWVRGHDQNRYNEECDVIATGEADRIAGKKWSAEISERSFSKDGRSKQQRLIF